MIRYICLKSWIRVRMVFITPDCIQPGSNKFFFCNKFFASSLLAHAILTFSYRLILHSYCYTSFKKFLSLARISNSIVLPMLSWNSLLKSDAMWNQFKSEKMFNILCRFISSKNYDVYIMSFPIFIIYLFYNVVCFILYQSYNIS